MTVDTDVPLRDYIESRLGAIEKAATLETLAMKESLASIYATRQEMKDQISRLIQDIKDLQEYKSKTEGKADMSAVYTLGVFTLVSTVVSLVALIKDFLK
jgi:hypothetical protein